VLALLLKGEHFREGIANSTAEANKAGAFACCAPVGQCLL